MCILCSAKLDIISTMSHHNDLSFVLQDDWKFLSEIFQLKALRHAMSIQAQRLECLAINPSVARNQACFQREMFALRASNFLAIQVRWPLVQICVLIGVLLKKMLTLLSA